jgi:hypothetical protein
MKLDDLMEEFRKHVELDALPRDEDGFYYLEFDDEVRVKIFELEESNQLIILSSLMRLSPGEASAQLMRILLAANFRWALTAGGSYGIEPLTNGIEYCLREPMEGMNLEKFIEKLENVTAALQTMLRELHSHLASASDEVNPAAVAPKSTDFLQA